MWLRGSRLCSRLSRRGLHKVIAANGCLLRLGIIQASQNQWHRGEGSGQATTEEFPEAPPTPSRSPLHNQSARFPFRGQLTLGKMASRTLTNRKDAWSKSAHCSGATYGYGELESPLGSANTLLESDPFIKLVKWGEMRKLELAQCAFS